jgi:hypothetical protein
VSARTQTARPVPAHPRRVPSPAELAAAVLCRCAVEAPAPAGTWRGRAADEAVLLIELCRWLEGCHRHRAPATSALVEVFAGLARRRAPVAPVRRFVRAVVRHAHVELGGSDPGRARRDAVVVGLLDQCYQEPTGEDPARPATVTRADRLLNGLPAVREEPVPAPAYLVVVLAEPATEPDDLPAGALAATQHERLHLLVPVERADRRSGVWEEVSRWLAEHGGLRAAGSFADAPGDVPQAAASARRLLALAAAPGGGGPADAAPMGGGEPTPG